MTHASPSSAMAPIRVVVERGVCPGEVAGSMLAVPSVAAAARCGSAARLDGMQNPHRVAQHQEVLPLLGRRRDELDDAPFAAAAVDAELRRLVPAVRRDAGEIDINREGSIRGLLKVSTCARIAADSSAACSWCVTIRMSRKTIRRLMASPQICPSASTHLHARRLECRDWGRQRGRDDRDDRSGWARRRGSIMISSSIPARLPPPAIVLQILMPPLGPRSRGDHRDRHGDTLVDRSRPSARRG